ncbi:MAG: transketolase family protein [Firmicutes bacterium]|nr:transketolase family protein [Bacillota bacterium]MBR7113255.1 transketolase family protein [Bacillota bacterium]
MSEVKKIATREAYGKALAELAATNPNVVVLDADLAKSTKTADFAKVAPDRFFDCGIAEQNMTGVAAGLAAAGKIPFASSFAVFSTGRAFEQIRNSVAYPKLNVKIAATHAGISVGEDGGSHQSIEDIALMRALPNMTVIVPADAEEARQAVLAAAEYNGPVYLRLGRLATDAVFGADYKFELGKGVLVRPGSDIVIFACGMMVGEALKAADLLAEEGISAAVANIATIKPLDTAFIAAQAAACGAALTVEEHSIIGGLGSAVAETLAETTPVPFGRVGVEDQFGQSGSPAVLLRAYGLTAENIASRAKGVIAKKK